jgi:hypothetical protein
MAQTSNFFSKPQYSQDDAIERSKLIASYLTFRDTNKFNPKDSILGERHKELVRECTTDFSQKLAALQNNDKHIIAGIAIGLLSFSLSFILPITIVAIGAFAYAGYCYAKRAKLAEEYQQASANLIGCMEWTLNDAKWADTNNDDAISKSELEAYPAVMNMFHVGKHILTKEQLKGILDKRIEKLYDFSSPQQEPGFLDRPLDAEQRALVHGIYGYGMGKPKDILKGFYYLACQAATWVKNKVTGAAGKVTMPENAVSDAVIEVAAASMTAAAK